MERDGNRKQRSLIPRSFFPSLWEEMEDRLGQWMGREVDTGVSVSEDDQNVYIEAQLPGLKSDDIDISLSQDTLWIKGEKQEEEAKGKKYYRRARNTFFYQVALPSQVEESSEKADFQDGILKITFKKTKQSQVRKIPIGNGKNQTQSKKGIGNQTKGSKQV